MGFVYKPIPLDILAMMPPDIRAQTIRQEREFLARVRDRQEATANFGLGVLVAVTVLALMLALDGATINWPWS